MVYAPERAEMAALESAERYRRDTGRLFCGLGLPLVLVPLLVGAALMLVLLLGGTSA